MDNNQHRVFTLPGTIQLISGNYIPSGESYTKSESDARYQPSGVIPYHLHSIYEISGTMLAHLAALDPHPQYLTQAEGDALYSSITNYTPSGYSYSKAESDTRFMLLGLGVVSGTVYTKTETQILFQASGNYETSGWSYTKIESDQRFQWSGIIAAHTHHNYELSGTAATLLAAHIAALDPHPQYLTVARADNLYAPDLNYMVSGDAYYKSESDTRYILSGTQMGSGISYTKAESDIRFQASGNYETSGWSYTKLESNQRFQLSGTIATHTHSQYELSGTAAAIMVIHSGAADPHPQYLLTSEGDSYYAPNLHYMLSGDAWLKAESDARYLLSGVILDSGLFYTKAESDTRYLYSGLYEPSGWSFTKSESDIRYQYSGILVPHTHSGFEISGTADARVAWHEAKLDPHPQYLTVAEADGFYAPNLHYLVSGDVYYKSESDSRYILSGTQIGSGISYTKAESDQRFQVSGNYEISGWSYTKSESDHRFQLSGLLDQLYELSGTAASIMAIHSGATDPHPQYLTMAEGDSFYAPNLHYMASGDAWLKAESDIRYARSGAISVTRLDQLTDVQIVALVTDNVLRYNGAFWVNVAQTFITDGGNF
jgi:hypothetical protein